MAGAAGPEEAANGVLQRFGFAAAEPVASVEAVVAALDADHYDLVVLPLKSLTAMELAALEGVLRRHPNTFALGTSPHAESELILRAMRAGIHEFLVFPPDPQELTAAVDRLLRRNATAEREDGRIVAVYSSKGGLGTTSVAVNLAFALAQAAPNGRVALADLVVSGGDVRVLLNLAPQYDIGDLVARANRIDAELLTSVLSPVAGGVWVLPASDKPEVAELVDAGTAATVLSKLKGHFAHTVLDGEHHLSDRTLAALDAADDILLITQLSVPGLRATQRTIALCQRLGYDDDKLRVVVNRHQTGDVLSLTDAAELLGRPVFHTLPNDYRGSAAAMSAGVPVGQHDASSRLAQAYGALAAKLTGALAPAGTNGNGRAGKSRLGKIFGLKRS